MDASRVLKSVDASKDEMVSTLSELCKIPAIPPESGGEGEADKFALLADILDDAGLPKGRDYPSKDKRVPGEQSLWKTDPYKPVVKGGKIYGRGTEDNGQAMVTSLYAAKALLDCGAIPKRDVMVAFVSDEEVGSRHGIQHIISEGIVKPDDLVVVPDSGSPNGQYIEVVEKSHLQLRLTVRGKQCHASRPNKGINAYRAASAYVTEATDMLYAKYDRRDRLFQPPYSTFEPTKKHANVPNVNTIPGEDVSFFDYRVLPGEDLDAILEDLKDLGRKHGRSSGARFDIETVSVSEAAPATPVGSPVVKALSASIKAVKGVPAKPLGIGGGTCAAYFRRAGIPAAVWATIDEKAHEPNEYAVVANLVSDAKVFAHMFLNA